MRAWSEVAVWWAVLVLVWLATLNSFSFAELVVAAVLALPCAVAARYGRQAAGGGWSVRPGWARWLLSLPWALLHDTAAMLAIAVRPERQAEDRFEDISADAPAGRGWEAAATFVVSATPGSVVVDAGEHHDRIVVHTAAIRATGLRVAVRR
jgi:multisubunit Na+/H+ antiporter MnhE subunit